MPKVTPLPANKKTEIKVLVANGYITDFNQLYGYLSVAAIARAIGRTHTFISKARHDRLILTLKDKHILAEQLGIGHHQMNNLLIPEGEKEKPEPKSRRKKKKLRPL